MLKNLIKGVMIAGLLVFACSSAYANLIWVECSYALGSPITNESGAALPEGCLVQLIRSADQYIGTPDASGIPIDGDVIIRVGAIGGTPEASYSAGEVKITSNEASNTLYYGIRAWNGDTVNHSSKYGTSSSALNPGGYAPFTVNPPSFSTIFPAAAPSGPTGFIGTGESITSIRWGWGNIASEDRYDLYTSIGSFIVSTGTDETTTLEAGLGAGNQAYTRYVKAQLDTGQTTAPSNQYTAYTLAITPEAITAKSGWKAGGNFVTVTWEANNSAGTNYYMHRVDSGVMISSTLKMATDEALLSNMPYTYEVRAMNGNGIYTVYSNQISAFTPPGAPVLSTYGVTTDEITWGWTTKEGADVYTFYQDSFLDSTINTLETRSLLTACRPYRATVEAVSFANGTGEPSSLTRWTLPVTPELQTALSGINSSVDLTWDDVNYSAYYDIQRGDTSADASFGTVKSNVSGKTSNIICNQADTFYWFRVKAKNGDDVSSGWSNALPGKSGSGGGGGGIPVTISDVKVNNKRFFPGDIVSSRPNLTAIITGELDVTWRDVWVDFGSFSPIHLPESDITYEPAQGMPAGTWQMSVVFRDPIPAEPVNAHTIRIVAKNTLGTSTLWEGNIAVMSGGVQMLGEAYNYPNPFKPLSANPAENTTRIAYTLNIDATINIIIYDITGHEVKRMTFPSGSEGGRAGINTISWDGRSIFDEVAGNGMYIYKVISRNKVIGTGKLVILD